MEKVISTLDWILAVVVLAYCGTVLWVLHRHTYTLRELLEYAKGQAGYIAEKRAEQFCKDSGQELCKRCRRRPVSEHGTQCESCGI